jgi:2-succinyl-6-hydroxy-2,4-cyclohexadiene-1-carboxylate synthase
MKIKLRGIEYYYKIHQEYKDLPYLILLHGFLGSSESYEDHIPSLSSFCNPITVDLLGHGKTEGSEMHYRFAAKEQTADLVKLISEQIQYPVFLYGYSMGGRLALQIALNRPDLFLGLILESTTFGIEKEQERQARQALDAQRADSILGNYDQFIDEWKKLPIFKSPQLTDVQFSKIEKIQRAQNPLWISNSLLGFGTGSMPCFKGHLNKIKIPVQLIAGAKDQKFINIMNAMQNRIEGSSLEVFENANHRVHLDQPKNFIETLRNFIQQNLIP